LLVSFMKNLYYWIMEHRRKFLLFQRRRMMESEIVIFPMGISVKIWEDEHGRYGEIVNSEVEE